MTSFTDFMKGHLFLLQYNDNKGSTDLYYLLTLFSLPFTQQYTCFFKVMIVKGLLTCLFTQKTDLLA